MEIIQEAKATGGVPKAIGNLLYTAASKVGRPMAGEGGHLGPQQHADASRRCSQYPANALMHRPKLLEYVMAEKVKVGHYGFLHGPARSARDFMQHPLTNGF